MVSSERSLIKLFIILIIFINSNIFPQSLTAEQVFKKVSDAVVIIHTYNKDGQKKSQGSGVILNDKGWVITNYHVMEYTESMKIFHQNQEIPFERIQGIDMEKDILILKIKKTKFPSLKYVESNKLKIGQKIFAIGSPLGFENTISEGIISGFRKIEEKNQNFIQITNSISPGSSGGAIVNERGDLIGISTLSFTRGQNLNFAITMDDILKVETNSEKVDEILLYRSYSIKGFEASSKGDYIKAMMYLDLYLNKFPFDAEIYSNRGLYKHKLGLYHEAIKDYDLAISLKPVECWFYVNRGVAKKRIGDFEGALEDFTRSIKINPEFESGYYNRAKLLGRELKNEISALQDIEKIIQLNPKNVEAYLDRGKLKWNLGDEGGACLDWRIAHELGDEEAYELLRQNCE